MQLVADVGSTDTKLGLFARGDRRPRGAVRLATEDAADGAALRDAAAGLLGGVGPGTVRRLVIGSVSASRTGAVRSVLEAIAPEAAVVELGGFDGLGFRPGPDGYPAGVGADRIANALAALDTVGGDVIVVDAGTATTVDLVGADGVFVGGAIAPGLGAGAAWLRTRAPHLPAVPLEAPTRAIGRSTEEALRSGIFLSAIEGVEGLVGAVRREWEKPDAVIMVTGGFAGLLAAHSVTFARMEPNLTLVGLALAGEVLGA